MCEARNQPVIIHILSACSSNLYSSHLRTKTVQMAEESGDGSLSLSLGERAFLQKAAKSQQAFTSSCEQQLDMALAFLDEIANKELEGTDLASQVRDLHGQFHRGLCSVKIAMQQVAAIIRELASEYKYLLKEHAELQAKYDVLLGALNELQHQRKQLMVGQLPYNLDYVATQYILGAGHKPSRVSLSLLATSSSLLSPEQSSRFNKFSRWLEQKGFSFFAASVTTSIVRNEGLDAAHGSTEEHAATTTEQLLSMAKDLDMDMEDFQQLLQLAALVSEDGKPLQGKPLSMVIPEIEAASSAGGGGGGRNGGGGGGRRRGGGRCGGRGGGGGRVNR